MPATGLKIFGTGACLPWCSISSSFQNSLKTSGHRCYEFLEFCCWNWVPFLPDICFRQLKSLWSSLTYFSFNDAPNVFYRWQIWTAGQFSSRTLLLRSHAVVIAAVCFLLKYTRPSSYIFQHSAFQNMQAAHTVCPYAPPYHQRCWLLKWTLITRWKVSLLFSPEDTASVISDKNVKFGLIWPLNTFTLWNSPI